MNHDQSVTLPFYINASNEIWCQLETLTKMTLSFAIGPLEQHTNLKIE